MLYSLFLFLIAGICEIGGGYLVWLWCKGEKSIYIGVLGMIILGLYGVVAAAQSEDFGRVYAAYGGIFIALSVGFAMLIDGFRPDKWDMIGGVLALLGAGVMMYAPRS